MFWFLLYLTNHVLFSLLCVLFSVFCDLHSVGSCFALCCDAGLVAPVIYVEENPGLLDNLADYNEDNDEDVFFKDVDEVDDDVGELMTNPPPAPAEDESMRGPVPSMGRITGSASIETLVSDIHNTWEIQTFTPSCLDITG